MTLPEMTQITLNFWMKEFRGLARKMPQQERIKQAMACARLTRKEMEVLMAMGMDEDTAWTETRNLFCLKAPPRYDPSQTA